MTQEFDKAYTEGILRMLEEQSRLFPQFKLKKVNNELQLLGTGGFSSVYEMLNVERPDHSFALKVAGFQRHMVSSAEFWDTCRIQWILGQESKYIMRILAMKELDLILAADGTVEEIKEATKEVSDTTDNTLRLQLVLMEKLDEILTKDRFANVSLLREELKTEAEVLKLAFEIGQALGTAHNNKCLHRDIKIENIFWDASEQIYKLGDFGIAKRTEDGNAETIAYTDGYGAPEIERRLYENYNATADIYSLGITLYLLLNDLKFPGSDGYYSKTEVQYNPDFIFPAPAHASEEMARVIRKMCSFYPKDRHQSMNEVLAELTGVLDEKGTMVSTELVELAEMATETFLEDTVARETEELPENREKTRAERIEEKRIISALYREDSIRYFFVITLLFTLLCKSLQTDTSMLAEWVFFALPAVVLIEAVFQKVKDFHVLFGTIVWVLLLLSVYRVGLTVPHILLLCCMVLGCPLLTLAGGVSTGLWMLLEFTDCCRFLDYLAKWDLGWIVLSLVMLVGYRYFCMKMDWGRLSHSSALLGTFIFDKVFVVMILVGMLLFTLDKAGVIIMPDLVSRMHLARTGALCFGAMCVFAWRDGILDQDTETKEGEEAGIDEELLDK